MAEAEQSGPKPKPERPRDQFGRPLPAGSANVLELPDFDSMTLEECHETAMQMFDEGHYFGAHEAWETCWGFAKETEEEEFFKGLAQLGAGFTHWQRGNAHGVVALLDRALERIGSMGSSHRGIDVAVFTSLTSAVRDRAREAEERREAPGELPEVRVPRTG